MSGLGANYAGLSQREYTRVAITLLHEGGLSQRQIESLMNVSRPTIQRWVQKQEDGLDFMDLPRPGIDPIYSQEDRKRLVAFYCQTTMLPEGHGRWTLRTAATYLQHNLQEIGTRPTRSTIQRILADEGLKPHRTKYFLHITDPDFFPKMEHLLELRRNPPENLFYFDECPGIHVRQRLSPRILAGMRQEQITQWLEEFEYIRHGTLDVFAFFENRTGEIYGECRADHTKATFHEVFRNHVSQVREQSVGRIDYVMDNLASHSSYEFCCLVAELCGLETPVHLEKAKAPARRQWLGSEDKSIVIHYTPFHGSWLNLVEVWFGILSRGCLKESYTSPDELHRAIMNFIEQWNLHYAHPFKFDYDGEGLHELMVKRFIRMHTSPEAFNNRFLGKQLRLLYNLFRDYRQQVPTDTWECLIETLKEKHGQLIDSIAADTKPKRKKQTLANLQELCDVLFAESKTEKVA